MSEKIEYPKFKYHAAEEPVMVHDAEEEEALGSDWRDSPADFTDEQSAPAAVEKPEDKLPAKLKQLRAKKKAAAEALAPKDGE